MPTHVDTTLAKELGAVEVRLDGAAALNALRRVDREEASETAVVASGYPRRMRALMFALTVLCSVACSKTNDAPQPTAKSSPASAYLATTEPPSSPVAPTPTPTATAPQPAPLSPAERAGALAGIKEMQALVGERLAANNHEHHDPCIARADRDSKRMAAASKKVGKSRMEQPTRWTATVETVVGDCVINCVQQDPDDQSDIESSRGDNIGDCQHAVSVLSDLATEVSASK